MKNRTEDLTWPWGAEPGAGGSSTEGVTREASAAPDPGEARYLSRTVQELREFGCFAAETGCGLAPYQTRLKEVAQARAVAVDAFVREPCAQLNVELRSLAAAQQSALRGAPAEPSFNTVEALSSALSEHDRTIADLEEEGRSPSYASRFSVEREAVLDALRLDRERMEERVHAVQPLLRMWQDSWDENAEALQHHARLFEERGRACRERLATAATRVERLHQAGISRPIAGLLVWASSIALAGTGFAVSRVIKFTLHSEQQAPQELLLLRWLGKVDTPWALLRLFGEVSALLLSALVLVAVATQLTRLWLRTADGPWPEGGAPAVLAPREKGRGGDASGVLGWVSLFGGPSASAGEVTDRSLRQLLASLPLVLAGAVLAFLLVSFGEREGGDEALVAAQLGSGFAFLSVISATLFITGMLYGQRLESPAPRLRAFLLFVIAVSPLLSLAVAGLLPGFEKRAVLSCVAISMMLGATGLTFGLIYRGQFAHEEYLEREILRCERRAAHLRQRPTLASVFAQARFSDEEAARAVRRQFESQLKAQRRARRSLARWVMRLAGGGPRTPKPAAAPRGSEAQQSPLLRAEQRLELRRLRGERAALSERLEQVQYARVRQDEAQEELVRLEAEKAAQHARLQEECAQALLEMENAYAVACATLSGVQTQLIANGYGGSHGAVSPSDAGRGEGG